MNVTEARQRLERMLAQSAADDPALYLGAADIADLLRLSAVADPYGIPSSYQYPEWQASHAYVAGDVVRATGYPAGLYFVAGDPGTSGATEPTWPTTAGGTVADGTVAAWTAYADTWAPTWDLNRGAAEGWLRKAGLVSARYDFSEAESQSFKRSQVYDHCMKQHRLYKSRIVGTIPQTVVNPATLVGVW